MSDRTTALTNLKNAVLKFEEYLNEPIRTDRDKAGVIQGFEFSFELSWKTIQKYGADMGVQFASPKRAFSYALKEGLIPLDEESLWLKMLNDRNITAHTYKSEVANEVLSRLRDYVAPICKLAEALEQKWK